MIDKRDRSKIKFLTTVSAFFLTGLAFMSCPEEVLADTIVKQTISSSLNYDNNASIVSTDQFSVSDFYLTLSPDISVTHERTRIVLDASYTLAGLFYFENTDLNTVNHSANAGVHVDLTQATDFSLTDSFGYTKDSRDTTTTGIQISRAEIITNSLAFGLNRNFGRRASAGINLEDRILKLQGANASNSRTDSASAHGSFRLTEGTTLNGSYTFSNFHFNANGVTNSFPSHSAQAGLSQVLTPSLLFSTSAGAVYTPTISDKYDWLFTGNVSKTFERTSLNFGYSRSLLNTSGLSSQMNISERFLVGVNHSLTQRLSLSVAANYTQNRSKPVRTVDLQAYDASASCNWTINDWMTASAGFNHFEQTSTGEIGSDIRRDSVFVNLNMTTFEKKY